MVDTSVHVSSEIFSKAGSPAKEVLARGFDGQFRFAVSPLLLDEISRKLVSFVTPVHLVVAYLADLVQIAEEHTDEEPGDVTCADPEDVFVRVLARTAAAWCVVAQDNALVDHEAVPPGWPPPVFLARLRAARGESATARFP